MRRGPVLWIIDPAVHDPEHQGVGEILDGWPGEARIFRPGLNPGDLPPDDAGQAAGVVVLGSATSVHDPFPWVARLGAWLGPWLRGERRTPVLGICFGHQLIAHAAGGRVDCLDSARTKRVGIETTDLRDGRLLGGHDELRVVVSHREHVVGIPRAFRVTATRDGVPVDGLEHERLPIFSFQFHPEAREEFAGRSGFDPALIDDRVRADSRRLLAAFRHRALRR